MAPENRKLEGDLTEQDFRATPVWRLAPDDENGESTVEPFPAELSLESGSVYLVATRVVLANGETRSGFVRIGRLFKFVEEGPLTLFLNGRQCEIEASIPGWAGTKPVSASEKQMLPIRWVADVAAAGERAPRTGSVSGSRFVYFIKSTIRGLRIQGMQ